MNAAKHEAHIWEFAARELDAESYAYAKLHFEDCMECREKLEAVQVARKLLRTAREDAVQLDWARVDEVVLRAARERLQPAPSAWLPRFGLGLAFAGAAIAVVFAMQHKVAQPVDVPAEPMAIAPAPTVAAPTLTTVDDAEGLVRGAGMAVISGTTVAAGDVLHTTAKGRAFLHLPDESHVQLAAATELSMESAQADDIALRLERGRVAVRASHASRKGFVVHAGNVDVHVVGTIFSVTEGPKGVDVSVTEGRVRVTSTGREQFVSAGEHVRIDAKGQSQSLPLTSEEQGAQQQLQLAADGSHTAPVLVAAAPAAGGTLPRLSAKESAARAKPQPQVSLPPPGQAWPSLDGPRGVPPPPPMNDEPPTLVVPALPPVEVAAPTPAPAPTPVPQSEAEQWANIPQPAAPVQAVPAAVQPAAPQPQLAVRDNPPVYQWVAGSQTSSTAIAPAAPPPRPQPIPAQAAPQGDLESNFLRRADASIAQGQCERYLLGLEEIASDTQKNEHSEIARILRARCFDDTLHPRQAMSEYRKYAEEYPVGRFRDEARRALGQ